MRQLNTLLNVIVFVGLLYIGYINLSRSKHWDVPDNAWFKSTVVDQPGLVVVKFGAEWCPPCRMLDPELTKLAGELGGRGSVVRINVSEHPELARHYGISSIPRLMIFDHGQVLADRVGYADHNQLLAWVDSVGPPSSPPPGPQMIVNDKLGSAADPAKPLEARN